jgi:hypothetical protein
MIDIAYLYYKDSEVAKECGKSYDPKVMSSIKNIPCNEQCGSGEFF